MAARDRPSPRPVTRAPARPRRQPITSSTTRPALDWTLRAGYHTIGGGCVKANETKLIRIIEGTNQYLVPHFQRPYTWLKKDWETLWADLSELVPDVGAESTPSQHFIGSIVTAPAHSVPEGVTKYLLIDGQQRLTTLLILLTAIRDRARLAGDVRLADRIHEMYLTNRFQEGDERYKLLPTQGEEPTNSDRAAFRGIVDGTHDKASGTIVTAHRHFEQRLRESTAEYLNSLTNAILGKVLLVSISLESSDNPYAIFESLNAKGQPLSQADLIRNLFFMSIESSRHETIYRRKWIPMEQAVGRENMEEFFRHHLISDGTMVRQSDVYFELKRRLDARGRNTAERYLDEIVLAAGRYARLVDPGREPVLSIRESLHRLNRLRATVAYPFLLKLFEERDSGKLRDDEMLRVLAILENFIIRRYITGAIRAELNNLFSSLYRMILPFQDRIEGLREVLGSRSYPSDDEFTDHLQTRQLYAPGGEIRDRARFILERIEAHLSTKETVEFGDLTIEHIMPQTLNDWWRGQLGTDAEDLHAKNLHIIGNLTLTGFNSELSNLPFPSKTPHFSESSLALNREIAMQSQWGVAEISARSAKLAKLSLEVWPNFSPRGRSQRLYVRGTTPVSVEIIGQSFPVASWQDVLRTTLSTLVDLDEGLLTKISDSCGRHVSKSTSEMRHARPLLAGYSYESHLNAEQIYRLCLQVSQIAGLSSTHWSVRTAENGAETSDSDTGTPLPSE